MKALTIRQPWAWAILHGGKRIENRSRTTHYRGEILIHASANRKRSKYEAAVDWIQDTFGLATAAQIPPLEELQSGGIIGRARIVDVVPAFGTSADYPAGVDHRWHEFGSYGWVLADVEPLLFVPCKGQLNFWEADYGALREHGPKCLVCGHYHGRQGACITWHAFVAERDCPTCVANAERRRKVTP